MKTCSKCKRSLDESLFVKSDRYRDGLYPHCKSCRKAKLTARLKTNPMCSKCGVKPHQPKHPYCYDCQRDSKGYTKPPKFRRDSNNKLCSKCKVNPRTEYGNYCAECARQYMADYYRQRGGQWECMTQEQRRISNVRHYANYLIKSGKVKRTPCVFCGAPSTEVHHYDYEDRTTNFDCVCKPCHIAAHRFLGDMLTMMKMGVRFPQLDAV